MNEQQFELILDQLADRLTQYLSSVSPKPRPRQFEQTVREVLSQLLKEVEITLDMNPPAQEFPDIVLGRFGIEVKYSDKDSWRSIANSIFEGRRNNDVEQVYLLFGKAGGVPAVKYAKYEDCIMHVRTSHVPRFEVEIGTDKPLFAQLGIEYEEFRLLPQHEKMPYIRNYAKARLKQGERLWWIEDDDDTHSLPLEVRLYTKLSQSEKRQFRAEAALLCPQIVQGSRVRGKYDDATMYLLTYHGVLCNQARDLFSAGSVAMRADQKRGGNYVMRALLDIQEEILEASSHLDEKLFLEYWGTAVSKPKRIVHWLKLLDSYAPEEWTPSQVLFTDINH